jgi:hypothetical protein
LATVSVIGEAFTTWASIDALRFGVVVGFDAVLDEAFDAVLDARGAGVSETITTPAIVESTASARVAGASGDAAAMIEGLVAFGVAGLGVEIAADGLSAENGRTVEGPIASGVGDAAALAGNRDAAAVEGRNGRGAGDAGVCRAPGFTTPPATVRGSAVR